MQDRQAIVVNIDKFEGLYKVKAIKTSKSNQSWAIDNIDDLKDFNETNGVKFMIGEKNDDVMRLYHDVKHMCGRHGKVCIKLQSKERELCHADIIKKDIPPNSVWLRCIKAYLLSHTHIFDTNDEIFAFQFNVGLWW